MTYINDGNGDPDSEDAIDGNVFVSKEAYDNVGAAPVRVVCDHMDMIFDQQYTTPYSITGYTTRSELPGLDTQNVKSDGSGAYNAFSNFLINNSSKKASTFNLCVTNRPFYYDETDGYAGLSGSIAVSQGAPNLESLDGQGTQRYYGPSKTANALRTGVHEIGHNLGMTHDNGMRRNDDIDGDGSEEYVQFPMRYTKGSENACGELVESNPNDNPIVLDMYYNWCSIENDDL